MKKLCFLLCLTSVLIASCKQKPQKQNPIPVVAEQKIDSMRQNDTIAMPIEELDTVSRDSILYDGNMWDVFKRDTIVGNFRIRHAIIYNNELIPESNFDKNAPFYHRDTDVEIEVEYNTEKNFHKVLSKDDFKEFFIKDKISEYQITYIFIDGVENEILSAIISLCMPDTDVERIFYLRISPDGGFTIEESDYEGYYEDEETLMAEINKVLAEVKKKDSLERANSIQMEQAVHNDTLKVDSVVIGN